ncbi:MAG: RNA polymerase sigma factor [Planctomycetota bacterium]|nr:RNA polymerase sigma factor [Planctomycetota bacterium]
MEWTIEGKRDVKKNLEEIYLKRRGELFGLAVAMVKDAHSAEDVLQDAFTKMLERIGSYKERGKMYNYLVRLVYTCAVDRLRRKKERRIEEEGDLSSKVRLPEEKSSVLEGVRRLPEEQRDVVLLRHYSGLSFAEIAEILGAPLGTVLSRMRYALIKLKEILEKRK